MNKDILYNKMSIIERCISRINEVYDFLNALIKTLKE